MKHRRRAIEGAEIVLAVGAATAGVAILRSTTSDAAGLGSLYLLAVLLIAIRRGQLAALVTAVVGVLTLNFFFIAPRHRLAIAHSQDLVELIVLLIAAVVVGRLAAVARERAAEAESRARSGRRAGARGQARRRDRLGDPRRREHRRPAREHRQPRRACHRRRPGPHHARTGPGRGPG